MLFVRLCVGASLLNLYFATLTATNERGGGHANENKTKLHASHERPLMLPAATAAGGHAATAAMASRSRPRRYSRECGGGLHGLQSELSSLGA